MCINPTVFISYSHDSKEHEEWVLKIATNLMKHGVEVILDQWDLKLGSDLRFFMEAGLSNANMVLCICSEEYVKKVDDGHGGAGYEGMIMTQPLLTDSNQQFIIPIVRNNSSNQKVPKAFGSKTYIDFSDDKQYMDNYKKLLERIYLEDDKKKPTLGENPFNNNLAKCINEKKRIESIKYYSPSMRGKVNFYFDNNNGKYFIGNGDYLFETKWSRAGNDSIYAMGNIGYKKGESVFPKLKELMEFDFSSTTRCIRTGEIIIFVNDKENFAAIKVGQVKSSSHGYPQDELNFEYYIYDKDKIV